MKKIMKYIIRFILITTIITLLYQQFDKDMDLFNWYMGALFEWLLINYISGGRVC